MSEWPAGVARLTFETIDSTNAEAARQVAAGSGPVWILAHEQTKGIGRRGRYWATPKGNFAASFVTPLITGLERAGLHSFCAALALREALIACGVAAERLTLKWPNDVLLDGGKLAGILLETTGPGASHLCIGIGVNLATKPDAKDLEQGAQPPKSLGADAGLDLPAETLLDHLAPRFAKWQSDLDTFGFVPIRTEWLKFAAKLGETITAKTPTEAVTGVFQTVDEAGAVILHTPKGPRSFHAADIFFDRG